MSQIAPPHPHTKWGKSIGIAIAASLAVGIIVLAFIWPGMTSKAKDLPIAITGPSSQVHTVKHALTAKAGAPFTVTTVTSRSDAVDGIKKRSYDGAIVLGTKPEVLTASAASPAVTPIMKGVQQRLQQQVDQQVAAAIKAAAAQAAAAGRQPSTSAPSPAGVAQQPPTVTVALTDVVPFAASDSNGTGLTVAAFPLTIGGMIGGTLLSILIAGVWRRLAAAAAYSVIAGFVIVIIMQSWFGILQGPYIVNVAAIAMALAGTAVFITGMTALIGRPGVAVGAVFTLLIGNPLSGATAPVQFLAAPWGDVGQLLVPGAATTLIRNLSYFPDASSVFAWLVLTAWVVLGVILTTLGHFRSIEVVHVENWDEEPTPTEHVNAKHAALA